MKSSMDEKKIIECRFDPGTAKPKFRVHMLLAHLESGQNVPRSRLDRYLFLCIYLLYCFILKVMQYFTFCSTRWSCFILQRL